MATLRIEAVPSDKIGHYKLAIDKKRVNMGANNKGTFELPGATCDDGSPHRLSYTLEGPAGAKLSIKVVCDDEVEVEVKDIEIEELGEPLAFGWQDFTL